MRNIEERHAETQASIASLNQRINALRKKCQEWEETSRLGDGQLQTCHTRNDKLGLNPQRDSRPTKEGREQDGLLHRPSNGPDDRSQRLSPQNSQRDLDEETPVDAMARSWWEAKCWEWSENDAAKHHRKALDCMIQAAEEVVEHPKRNNLLRQEVIDAKNELAKAVQAKNSRYWVQKAGLNAEAHIASPTTRTVGPTFNQTMNEGGPRMDVEQETAHYCRRSIALTNGQGIPNHINVPSEQYDGIARMIGAALAKGQHTDPDKSVSRWAGVKLDHPETYAGGSDLEEFEVAQKELFTRRDQRWNAGQLPRHSPHRRGARMVLQKCRMIRSPGPWVELGNGSAVTTEEIPEYLDTPSCVK